MDPLIQFSFHDISQNSLLNETLASYASTVSPPNSIPNNRIDRQDRNVRSSIDKNSFDPMKVYNTFGNMTNSTMRIILHGFGSSCRLEWIDEMKSAFFAVEKEKSCIVICVDWEKGAAMPK